MEQMKQETPEKIDLFPIFRNLWKQFQRRWWIILLLAALGGGLRYWQSVRSYQPMYQSEAIFSVRVDYSGSMDLNSYSYYYDNDAAQLAAETFPYLLNSDVMTERLLTVLDADYLNGSIEATAIPGTNFFSLTVKSSSPRDAYAIAQAVLEVYPQVSRLVIGDTQMTVSQEPVLAEAPYNSPGWKRSTLTGALAGTVAGGLILLVLALMNPTVSTEKDIKQVVNLDCLAQIPNVRRKRRSRNAQDGLLITNQEADSAFNEAFRLLRLKILRLLKTPDEKVLLFTSSLPSEGKSSLAANTALALAKDGKRVLLIDGDLRAQSLKSLMGISAASHGLGYHLKHRSSIPQFLQYRDTSLYLLAGDDIFRSPIPLLKHDRLSGLMNWFRTQFDYILIDTPPCAMMADATVLSRHADQVIYVIREDFASRAQILDGVQTLSGSGASICGFVMNRVTGSGNTHYGYGYGYGYGHKYGYGYKYGKESGYGRSKAQTYGADDAKR